MRYIIAGSIAFALVAGIALGFVFRGGAFEAEAKPPPPKGRLIELGTLTAAGQETVEFPLVKTDDCSQVGAFATTPLGPGVEIQTSRFSLDGTNLFFFSFQNASISDAHSAGSLRPWPFTQLRVKNIAGPGSPVVEITAQLWCVP